MIPCQTGIYLLKLGSAVILLFEVLVYYPSYLFALLNFFFLVTPDWYAVFFAPFVMLTEIIVKCSNFVMENL